MRRRTYLATLGGGLLAGCVGTGRSDGGTETGTPSLPPPTLGDPEGDVTVLAYEDFACPHCRTYALDVLPRLREEYVATGRVRYEHHDFPIPVDERWSWAAAIAARAVQHAAGDDAFFDYAARLYRNQDAYSTDLLARSAEAVGVDSDAVRRAVDEERFRPVVAADRRDGRERGVSGTPTVFVAGDPVSGYSYDRVSAAIDSAL